MKFKHVLFTALGTGIISSCNEAKEVAEEIMEETNLTSQTIDLSYMDNSVRPQDDFFQFSNGTWLKENPVPSSESRWGSFNELDKANKKKLTSILEESAKSNATLGTKDQILGDYYSSYIDMNTRNELGIGPVKEILEYIDKIDSKEQIPSCLAELHSNGIGGLFGFGVGQDLKDIDNHISYFGQSGIGLPNRDYYYKEEYNEIFEAYKMHVEKVMSVVLSDAHPVAKSIVKFEMKLAESMMEPAMMRIPEKTYNKMPLEDFKQQIGSFNFEKYLSKLGSQSFDTLVVGQPDFVTKINELVQSEDLNTWKNYLKWNVLNQFAGALNDEMVQLNFDFYGKTLKGTKEMKPIKDRAIENITDQVFSELLGKAFVDKHFSESAKNRVNKMVDNLLVVFQDRINNLDWMSDSTKREALIKLNSIGRKLGFPDKWEDFSSLKFKKDDYVGNLIKASKFAHRKNMAKLNKPVDKDEWGMPAHMVNAYYHPLLNEIAFPAGIMQAPFFSEDYEDAVNYGRIGMVIGHEFTHGFDDMGSKFAADGSFKNWWTDSDRKLFEERTKKLGKTFEKFCPVDGHCVNPQLTMGENIADLGGLTMAYHAYTLTPEYLSQIKKKGYTPAQRFFIAYAQLWKINYTEEELKNRIANDPHSPGMYRVNGPLMNCPEFFEAFDVTEDDKMRNKSEAVSKIW